MVNGLAVEVLVPPLVPVKLSPVLVLPVYVDTLLVALVWVETVLKVEVGFTVSDVMLYDCV
jgi:hypothetical protein